MSLQIDRLTTPNYTSGRDGHRPLGVVIHTNVGSFGGTIAWFASPESRVSSHYLVALDGRVVQFVDEPDTARHAGRVHKPSTALVGTENPNLYTVGIEFEDGGDPEDVARTREQYAAGAELLRGIAERWAIPLDRRHVVGHREIYALKTCPGNFDIDRLILEAASGEE